MTNENDLEEQCEDAVFEICCVRERYSVRCADKLQEHLELTRKKLTAEVKKSPAPDFETPVITEDQQKLFDAFESNQSEKTSSKSEEQIILKKLKELKKITEQIERSKNSELNNLLKE